MFTPALKLKEDAIEQDNSLRNSCESPAPTLSERLVRLERLISKSEAHLTARAGLLGWSPFVADASCKELSDMRRAVIIFVEYKEYLMDRLREAGGGRRLLEASPSGAGDGRLHRQSVEQAGKIEIEGASPDQLKLREPTS